MHNNNSHLFFAHAEQLIVHLSNNIDKFNVLTSQFFVASFFKILCNLNKENHNIFKGCNIFIYLGIIVSMLYVKFKFTSREKVNTFGILKGFFAAYSHNFTIFLSLGEPSCIHKMQSNLLLSITSTDS